MSPESLLSILHGSGRHPALICPDGGTVVTHRELPPRCTGSRACSPGEVEDALSAHRAVTDAVCFGIAVNEIPRTPAGQIQRSLIASRLNWRRR